MQLRSTNLKCISMIEDISLPLFLQLYIVPSNKLGPERKAGYNSNNNRKGCYVLPLINVSNIVMIIFG